MQTGLYAGRRISHESLGQTYEKPFRYHDLGSAALFSWWFAFTRDLRRERTFTIDDMPVAACRSQAGSMASPKTPTG
jgi:hypothetical protein